MRNLLYLATLTLFISENCHGTFTIEVEGETHCSITPKLSVIQLAHHHESLASMGIPDATTPLQISGQLRIGYHSLPSAPGPTTLDIANINPGDSLQNIVASLRLNLRIADYEILESFDSTGNVKQMFFKFKAKESGKPIQVDISNLNFPGFGIDFQNGQNININSGQLFLPSIPETESSLSAKYTLSSFPNHIFANSSNTLDMNNLKFIFKSVKK